MHTKQALMIFSVGLMSVLLLNSCRRETSLSSEPTPVLSQAPNTTYPMPPLSSTSGELGWLQSEGDDFQNPGLRRGKIADYKGQVLVLDFYATWCMPCRESIPHLNQLQRSLGAQGLRIVGLNVGGADDRVKVPDFARELQIQYRLGFPDQSLTDLFLSDDASIPQTFVFDREGRLVKRFIGYGPPTAMELDKAIQSAIS
ncbi:MAG TPA: TlpA disulfide reductase family protein [Pyrinomonadaceae bacterium]|nr:TlpA disulfide reductase family protein [Pyrinomonadaceae bacterium]